MHKTEVVTGQTEASNNDSSAARKHDAHKVLNLSMDEVNDEAVETEDANEDGDNAETTLINEEIIKNKVHQKKKKKNQAGITKVVENLCYRTKMQELKDNDTITTEQNTMKKGKARRQTRIAKAKKTRVERSTDSDISDESNNKEPDINGEDPNDDEIMKIIRYKKEKGTSKFKVTVLWRNAGEWITDDMSAVVQDGWEQCLAYINLLASKKNGMDKFL